MPVLKQLQTFKHIYGERAREKERRRREGRRERQRERQIDKQTDTLIDREEKRGRKPTKTTRPFHAKGISKALLSSTCLFLRGTYFFYYLLPFYRGIIPTIRDDTKPRSESRYGFVCRHKSDTMRNQDGRVW